MEQYSLIELSDMHLVYGAANQSGRRAARIYAQRFPQRRHPAHTMFQRLDQRLRETGSLRANMSETGRPRSVTPDVEEVILGVVEEEPSVSSRAIARRVQLSQSTVLRILHEQLFYPFHPQRVQCLNPDDYPRRREFCEWFLHQSALIPDFSSCVLFTDESSFTRDGIFNTHNQHIWDQVNPFAIAVRSHQVRFSVNIWCGIIHKHYSVHMSCQITGTFWKTTCPFYWKRCRLQYGPRYGFSMMEHLLTSVLRQGNS